MHGAVQLCPDVFRYREDSIMKPKYIAVALLACAATPQLMAADYYDYHHYPAGTTVVRNSGATHYFHDQATISVIQQRLLGFGYSVPVDGVFDAYTVDAVKHFQQVHGFAATGAIDQPTMAALGLHRRMSGSVGGAPIVLSSGAPIVIAPGSAIRRDD
jgi:hypothetical protein